MIPTKVLYQGRMVMRLIGPSYQTMKLIKHACDMMKVANAKALNWKSFRAGKASQMANKGDGLDKILQSENGPRQLCSTTSMKLHYRGQSSEVRLDSSGEECFLRCALPSCMQTSLQSGLERSHDHPLIHPPFENDSK